MIKKYTNVCSRCGKERVPGRTWIEKIDRSIITNTEMKCPDKECQQIVERENKKQKDKNTAMRLDREKRTLSRKIAQSAKRSKK